MSKKHHETRAAARALRKYHRLNNAANAARYEAEQEEQNVWRDYNAFVRVAESEWLRCGTAEAEAELVALREGGPSDEDFARRDRLHAEAHELHVKACAAGVRAGLAQYAEDGVTLVWKRVQCPRPAAETVDIHPVIVFGDLV